MQPPRLKRKGVLMTIETLIALAKEYGALWDIVMRQGKQYTYTVEQWIAMNSRLDTIQKQVESVGFSIGVDDDWDGAVCLCVAV